LASALLREKTCWPTCQKGPEDSRCRDAPSPSQSIRPLSFHLGRGPIQDINQWGRWLKDQSQNNRSCLDLPDWQRSKCLQQHTATRCQ
jgi:hypothetical protein